MTKQQITEIITNGIVTQLQRPKSALDNITTVYGQWLRRTVKEAQTEASQPDMPADEQQQGEGASNVQTA